MPKIDFNKAAKQPYWNPTSAWVFSCKFATYFQKITFYIEQLLRAASVNPQNKKLLKKLLKLKRFKI